MENTSNIVHQTSDETDFHSQPRNMSVPLLQKYNKMTKKLSTMKCKNM